MRRLLPLLALLLPAGAAAAPPPSPSLLCETAIAGAETTLRLPLRLMSAISQVESGRLDAATGAIRAWPWTINAEGRGQFFASKQQALDAVRALQAQGVRSIDVGCMQVNLMYHPTAFASLDEAFDPTANALYAGRFLNTLYGISGSWMQATAAYHSQTPMIGAAYQQRVAARWQHPGSIIAAPVVQTAYHDFAPVAQVYRAFESPDRVYGAFTLPASGTATRLAGR